MAWVYKRVCCKVLLMLFGCIGACSSVAFSQIKKIVYSHKVKPHQVQYSITVSKKKAILELKQPDGTVLSEKTMISKSEWGQIQTILSQLPYQLYDGVSLKGAPTPFHQRLETVGKSKIEILWLADDYPCQEIKQLITLIAEDKFTLLKK